VLLGNESVIRIDETVARLPFLIVDERGSTCPNHESLKLAFFSTQDIRNNINDSSGTIRFRLRLLRLKRWRGRDDDIRQTCLGVQKEAAEQLSEMERLTRVEWRIILIPEDLCYAIALSLRRLYHRLSRDSTLIVSTNQINKVVSNIDSVSSSTKRSSRENARIHRGLINTSEFTLQSLDLLD
jgi:hypothetical protein